MLLVAVVMPGTEGEPVCMHAPEFGGKREKVRIAVQMLRCADSAWTVCWFDVITQMFVGLIRMLHLNGGDWPREIVCNDCFLTVSAVSSMCWMPTSVKFF